MSICHSTDQTEKYSMKNLSQIILITFLCLIIFSSSSNAQEKRTKSFRIQQELWKAIVVAYNNKDRSAMKVLIEQYPDWSRDYAQRLLTGYLSFSYKNEKEKANRNISIARMIAYYYERIYQTKALARQVRLYKEWSWQEKKEALEAVMGYPKAVASANVPLYQEIIQRFEKLGDDDSLAITYLTLGKLYHRQGNFLESQKCFQESLNIFTRLDETISIANVKNALALLAYTQKKYAESERIYKECIVIYEERGYLLGLGNSYNNMGSIAHSQKKWEKAQEYYKKSYDFYEKIQNQPGSAAVLNNLGVVAFQQKKYDEARSFYQKSLAISRFLADRLSLAQTLQYLGELETQTQKYIETQKYYSESVKFYQSLSNFPQVALLLERQGDIAKKQQDFSKARKLYTSSLDIYKTLKKDDAVKNLEAKIIQAQEKKNFDFLTWIILGVLIVLGLFLFRRKTN